MKIKLESIGCGTKTKEEYVKYCKDLINIDIDQDKVEFNEGMRWISKICLNNFWGHFGMRDNFLSSDYIDNDNSLVDYIFNPKYKDQSVIILNDDFRLITYRLHTNFIQTHRKTNIFIAVYTTAHARLRLYKLLDILGERVCGNDTDSVFFADDGSEAVKEINDMIGEAPGKLTDENKTVTRTMEGEIIYNKVWMDKFVSNGPKDYSQYLNNGSQKGKCKGFKTNAMTEELVTFENRENLIDGKGPINLKETRFVLDKQHDIKVKEIEKVWDFDLNKRMIVYKDDMIDTLPYGF